MFVLALSASSNNIPPHESEYGHANQAGSRDDPLFSCLRNQPSNQHVYGIAKNKDRADGHGGKDDYFFHSSMIFEQIRIVERGSLTENISCTETRIFILLN